jgi:hypothetical protein
MGDAIEPQIYEPDESLPRDLLALRRFARLMDAAVEIPGLRKRIGIDAAVGLIPGFGDAAGAVFSFTIILAALRHRVPFRKVMKMVAKVVIDVLVGTIPVLGDVFDVFFQENMQNVETIIRNRNRAKAPRGWREAGVAVGILTAAILFVAAILSIAIVWFAIVAIRSR